MSFLSGILDIGKSAIRYLSGNSIGSTLARTALLGYAVNKLSQSALKDNNSGTANIDQGVRLQIEPNSSSKIPVLYGGAFFGGNITDAAMTNSNKTMWYCLTLSEKTGNLYSTSTATSYVFNNIYWNDQRVIFNADGITVNYTVDRSGTIDRSLSGLVRIYFYAGGRTAGQLPSGYAGSVPNAETLFPNWTAGTHPMTNLLFALVRVDYNRDKNVTGLGNLMFNITSSMKTPGDVLYDYLTNGVYGAGIAGSDINTSSIAALNSYSIQSVAYDDQGTGAQTLDDRYQINGLIDTANPVLQNAEAICSASGSWLSYDNIDGKWGVVINKTASSVASFSDSNILGPITVTGTGLQDLYNAVKVEFPHRELRDSADFVSIEIDAGDRNANEEDNTLNVTYDIINEPIQAQILGLIELKQSRIDLLIQFQTDYTYINLKAGDVVSVTNSRLNFTSKLFRIISITEVQEEDGALLMDITALEYDANVYSVADLYRYTRSDVNGIITIGSIGVPGTPTVTKFEEDSRPRVVISSTAPTGVVEGMEFWLTTDVGTGDDSLRSYNLIATRRPVGGGVFTSGTAVTLDYDQLGTTNFYIKTRGFNTTTVGTYSNPSGLVEFAPTQVTDALSPDTIALDAIGNQLGAILLIDLLSNLFDLYPTAGSGSKSVFERIFETFEDETGVDLVGQASDGSLVVAAALESKDGGTSLTANTSSLDFTSGLAASASGNDVSVKIIDGTEENQVLVWDGTSWVLGDSCCPMPNERPPNRPATPCSLVLSATLPADSSSPGTISGCGLLTNLVPHTGSYYARFAVDPGNQETVAVRATTMVAGTTYEIAKVGNADFTLYGASSNTVGTVFTATGPIPDKPAPLAITGWVYPPAAKKSAIAIYSALTKGTGNVKLYATDGTLEQTLPASSLIIHKNVVEFPFAPRTLGKDYYINMDEGVLVYCLCENVAIADNTTWTFTVSPFQIQPYGLLSNSLTAFNAGVSATLTVKQNSDSQKTPVVSPYGTVCPTVPLSITWSEPVEKLSGLVTVTTLAGSTVASFNVSSATFDTSVGITPNTKLNFGNITGLSWDTGYRVNVPASLVRTIREGTCGQTLPQSNNIAYSWSFTTEPQFALQSYTLCSDPYVNDSTRQKVNVRSNILLTFNKAFTIKATSPARIYIYEQGGVLHQTIDLRATYAANKVGVLYGPGGNTLIINPTKIMKPGKTYYLQIENGALIDASCEVPFAGITDTSTVTWKTDGINTSTPAAPNPAIPTESASINFQFDRPVRPGTGNIKVKNSSGQVVALIPSTSSAITYS